MKKILILIIVLIILLGLYLVYNYFNEPIVKAPTTKKESPPSASEVFVDSDFKGPSGPPSIKGPESPPPQY